MPQKLVDPYSLSCAYLETFLDRDRLLTATGFFWKHGGDAYLISNWHVFSGRSPTDKQPLDTTFGRLPNRMRIECYPKGNPNATAVLDFQMEDSNGPIWEQHSIHGPKVDVAVVNLTNLVRNSQIKATDFEPQCINEIAGVTDMRTHVGSDIFILGYPLGIRMTGIFPVWKRGSIATEFDIDINQLPNFLVDTATRQGMSGAPVIMRAFFGYSTTDGGAKGGPGPFNQFIGIYSGRHVGEIGEAQLGIVWKDVLISEIIDNPAVGDNTL